MFLHLTKKIFGSANDRVIKSITKLVRHINSLEAKFTHLSDQDLQNYTSILKEKFVQDATLDSILPEAFCVVREASRRVLNMRHFDVQLIGGIALHQGKIAEMKTGEGKTLVATLPAYLNALTGKGVHIVTVNDYLAKRDAAWMGKLYNFLRLSVGCITNDISENERRSAYKADITYGTNNEFGFDYLKDNLKYSISQMAQRPFYFAIIDEVDSILIDEARTPLIISGPTEENSALYYQIDRLVTQLSSADYEKDEKSKTIFLTDAGHDTAEKLLKLQKIIKADSTLYDYDNMAIVHHLNQALRAHHLFHKDVDYIINADKVMIIDEFTGRIMEGRRYSDGLHQALEAKENVVIQNENQTLASITFQNYFRLYKKLSGMTGTAMTEANEFADIYKLDVLEIPTHLDISRKDEDDEVYQTARAKYAAIIEEIKEAYRKEQPVLVGTISIEKSEYISSLLKKHKIPHSVLNARYHEREAEIIAQAGRPKAVTIATNMAGRGTDIMLGGNVEMLVAQGLKEKNNKKSHDELYEEIKKQVAADKEIVLKAGGLYVIGTERHESRRIDNQLRGRSGRQGDIGRTKFYLSLEDDLMRLFGSEKMSNMLTKLGLKEDEPIAHPWVTRALQKAQQKVEAKNYDIRKNLLKFDDVMNEQRKVVYTQRIQIMESQDLFETLQFMTRELNKGLFAKYIKYKEPKDEWDILSLEKELFRIYDFQFSLYELIKDDNISRAEIQNFLNLNAWRHLSSKIEKYGVEIMQQAIKRIYLISLDSLWKEHLHTLDYMRNSVNLRAYANKDPLSEYKIEAFALFKQMLKDLEELVIQRSARLVITHDFGDEGAEMQRRGMIESRNDPNLHIGKQKEQKDTKRQNAINSWGKIGRNDLCPCQSGKKFKHCHGAISQMA